MILQIGSGALFNHRLLNRKTSNDLDFIATHDDFKEFFEILKKKNRVKSCYPLSEKKIIIHLNVARIFDIGNNFYKNLFRKNTEFLEFEIAYPDSVAEKILKHESEKYVQESIELDNYRYSYASMKMLLLLKTSHRYLKNSPHFEKTRNDILYLRKCCGSSALNSKSWSDLLKEREKETYNYSHPNLNVVKKDFFTSNVKYVYDHDSIHEAIAIAEKPAYMYYKSPGADVMCDRRLFEFCPVQTKLNGILEEAFVLALERSQIPWNFEPDSAQSFKIALQKICTSITSGWFREYAWENYDNVLKEYYNNKYGKCNYVERFLEALNAARIKKYEASV